MRFLREDMDTLASTGPPKFDDNLRRLVDCLPNLQRHVINRVVFSGQTMNDAAREAGISRYRAETEHREAIKTLRKWVDDPETAPTHDGQTATPAVSVKLRRGPKPHCAQRTEWGRCVQPAPVRDALCPFHEEIKARGAKPDPSYERLVVTGQREPQQARFSKGELEALLKARYRGDGRRLDAYATADPLEIDL